MKQALLTLILTLITVLTFAQFQKGNKVLGFGFGLAIGKGETQNSQYIETGKSNFLSGSIELGFATKENKLHGFYIGSGYTVNKSETNQPFSSNIKNSNQSYNAGYFTRMYKSLGKGFFVFGNIAGGYSYTQSKIETNTLESTQRIHAVTASFFPGFTYKWNHRFLLEVRTGDFIAVGYNNSKVTNNITNSKFVSNNLSVNTSLGLGFLQNFGIGGRWIIGQNKKA